MRDPHELRKGVIRRQHHGATRKIQTFTQVSAVPQENKRHDMRYHTGWRNSQITNGKARQWDMTGQRDGNDIEPILAA